MYGFKKIAAYMQTNIRHVNIWNLFGTILLPFHIMSNAKQKLNFGVLNNYDKTIFCAFSQTRALCFESFFLVILLETIFHF